MNVQEIAALQRKAIELRVEAIQMIHRAGAGHSGDVASVMEILTTLYYGELPDGPVMQYQVNNPGWVEQDYFILSKYTAAPGLYAVLADLKFFPKDWMESYRQLNSKLQAYPTMKVSGVNAAIGSAGEGLSVALGLALALKMERKKNRVFVLVEERELQNGQFWEAVMAAAHYQLDNIVVILELNGVQTDGAVRSVMSVDPVSDKFEAFGWKNVRVHDGHDVDKILTGLQRAVSIARRPKVVLCKTIVGKGVPFAERKHHYAGAALSKPEMVEFLDYSEQAWKAVK